MAGLLVVRGCGVVHENAFCVVLNKSHTGRENARLLLELPLGLALELQDTIY